MEDHMKSIDRRSFLTGLSATPVLLQCSLSGAQAATAGFKLGVASYSLRKFNRTQAIAMVKQLNTPYINIKEFHLLLRSTPDEIDVARKEFQEAGLIILGGGNISFLLDDDADIRHKFEYAKLAGMPIIVCAPTARTLPKLERFVKEYDIKIAIHNHGRTDKHFPTPQSALKFVNNMDPRCGLCVDVGHTAETGVDVVDSIRQAGSRLLDVHIKDTSDLAAASKQTPVGEGMMPVAAIFRQLTRMNYQGGVMLEYEV